MPTTTADSAVYLLSGLLPAEALIHKRMLSLYGNSTRLPEKVQVGKDQEKAQSEKDSHSKNRGGKKPNQQSGTYTMKHIVCRMSSYFPNRWPLSYLNLTKNMKTYIRRQQHKNVFQTPRHKTKRTTTEVSTWNDQ